MVPTTASGRFRLMFLLMLGVLIVGVALWLLGALNDPNYLFGTYGPL